VTVLGLGPTGSDETLIRNPLLSSTGGAGQFRHDLNFPYVPKGDQLARLLGLPDCHNNSTRAVDGPCGKFGCKAQVGARNFLRQTWALLFKKEPLVVGNSPGTMSRPPTALQAQGNGIKWLQPPGSS
jgi:hypothetical protein